MQKECLEKIVLSGPVKSIPASNVSKHRYGGVHRLTLLGNNSIMSGTAPSGLCHGLPGKVRENRRVVDEPRLNRRLCQYPLPSLHLPHHASSNDYHGDWCRGPGHLHVQGYEYCNSGCSVLLGFYKFNFLVCGAHLQVGQASLPSRQRQTSTSTRSRPEIAWKLDRKDRAAPSLAFHLRFGLRRVFLLLPS